MMVKIDKIATLNFGRLTSTTDAMNLLNHIGE